MSQEPLLRSPDALSVEVAVPSVHTFSIGDHEGGSNGRVSAFPSRGGNSASMEKSNGAVASNDVLDMATNTHPICHHAQHTTRQRRGSHSGSHSDASLKSEHGLRGSRPRHPNNTRSAVDAEVLEEENRLLRLQLDSFGNIPYTRLFHDSPHEVFGTHGGSGSQCSSQHQSSPQQQQGQGHKQGFGEQSGPQQQHAFVMPPTAPVPWQLRSTAESGQCENFAFLSSRYFWFSVQLALRVTLIAMLVPAAIINAKLSHSPFVSMTFALTGVVIATGTNVGESGVYFLQFIRAGCIWLPLATICAALKLNEYLAAWFVVYVVLLFLMAVFTTKITSRLCLMLFNIAMVSLLSGNQSLTFPSRVLLDWFIGAAFALVAVLLPYPLLATRISIKITETLFKNTATCFTGILDCFWAPSNTERSMSMVRIRHLVRTLDALIEKFDKYDASTMYEVLFFETVEKRDVRKEKVKLLVKLKMNLRSMERVINILQEKPQVLDQSERCLLFRENLLQPIEAVSRAMEVVLHNICIAKEYAQLRQLGRYFDMGGVSVKSLQDEFDVARKILLYENVEALECDRLEEYVPLMTFFVFSIVNFWKTLDEFHTFIEKHECISHWNESFCFLFKITAKPFIANAKFVTRLFSEHEEADVRVVIEAAKVSVAMLISVIFFYYIDDQTLLLSGPTIIAFVSGSNPVEAVRASAARLSGTLIGSVVGFFAATLSHNAVDRVVSLCVITFVMTFFRFGYPFSTICMYCNFVAVSNLSPTQNSAEYTITRIQQNTFSMFVYCIISIAVFPVSPNRVLYKQRVSVVKGLSGILKKLVALMYEASSSYRESNNNNNNNSSDNFNSNQADGVNGVGASTISRRRSEVIAIDMDGVNKFSLHNAFTMAPEDKVMGHIFTEVFLLFDIMKESTKVMTFASGEIYVVPREYPLRASGDIHAALYRLCALVYTMACSWKLMRDKGYFTPEMVHVFHSLLPISMDIMQCMDTFSSLLVFYVRAPASGLSSELTKCAMQLRALCVELSLRKEKAMLAIIRKTILTRGRFHGTNSRGHRGNDGGGGAGGATGLVNDISTGSNGYTSNDANASPPAPPLLLSKEGRKMEGRATPPSPSVGHGTRTIPACFSSITDIATLVPAAVDTKVGARTVEAEEVPMLVDTAPEDAEQDLSRQQSSRGVTNETRIFTSTAMNSFAGAPPLEQQQQEQDRSDGSAGAAVEVAVKIYTEEHDAAHVADGCPPHPRLTPPPDLHTRPPLPTSPMESLRRVATSPQSISLQVSSNSNYRASIGKHPEEHCGHCDVTPGSLEERAQHLREEVHRQHRLQKEGVQYKGSVNSMHSSSTMIDDVTQRHRTTSVFEFHSSDGGASHCIQHSPRSPTSLGQRTWSARSGDDMALARVGTYGDLSDAMHVRGGGPSVAAVAEASNVTLVERGATPLPSSASLPIRNQGGAQEAQETRGNEKVEPIIHDEKDEEDVFTIYNSDDELNRGGRGGPRQHSMVRGQFCSSSSSDENAASSASMDSLVHFNDSFHTPVMVVDAEGLHSFTLSLEMFAKELRRVLYGLEEMLQNEHSSAP